MKYAAKKIVWMLLTMVIVSFLAFLAFRIIPGDPTAKLLGEQATPERVEALRQELGLDRPFLERYVSWLGDFVRGDMGSSYNYSMPVSQMLQGKIPVTGLLTLLSFLLIVVLSIPLGLFTARHSGGALDKALTVVNQVLMAVPAFFTGILLTYLFGLLLRWFVPGSFVSPAESFWQSAGYLVFPAAAIAIPRIAMTVKMLRSALLAEMNKDYVRTSYSRGNDRPPCAAKRPAAGGELSGHDGGGYRGGLRGHRAGLCHPGSGAAAADLHFQPGLSGGASRRGTGGLLGGAGEPAGGSAEPAAGSPSAADGLSRTHL